MSNAYDNYGDQAPDAALVDRGVGTIREPVEPRRGAPSRGAAYMWTGIALVIVSIFLVANGLPADEMAGDALLICGVLNIATSGIIRAIVDNRS